MSVWVDEKIVIKQIRKMQIFLFEFLNISTAINMSMLEAFVKDK